MMRVEALMVALLFGGCTGSGEDTNRSGFPPADRPVSDIISSQFSDEETRDRLNEAETVMDMADIEEGMTVADIGAGNGYYTCLLYTSPSPRD